MCFHKKELFRNELQLLGNFADVMSHPVRVQIIEMLAIHGHMNVDQISRHTPLHKTTISHHLAKLRELDLVDYDIHAPHIYYGINWEVMNACAELFQCYFGRVMQGQ